MFSRKRLVLIIALAAAISISTISPATLSRKGRTLAAPLTMNVLQGGAIEQDKPTASEVAASNTNNERKLRIRSRLDLSLVVKEVRNLQSATWYKDLEIEVKNDSQKRIYSILAYLTFPDDYSDRSKVAAVSLRFGSPKYLDIRVLGNPSDPHLKPGETCVLKLHEWYWDILRRRQEKFPERFRSFGMGFNLISFGDQTGVTVNGPRDYRKKPNK